MILGDDAHHDGSPTCVRPGPLTPGSVTTMFVLDPGGAATEARVRVVQAGRAGYEAGRRDHDDADGSWWRFDIRVESPDLSYRFELARAGRTGHVNGTGVHSTEPTDHADFRLHARPGAPDWAREAILYQVLIDRFARSGTGGGTRWTDDVIAPPDGMTQFFGGDLDGIGARLDHVAAIGGTALCLTPFFPSPEYHRYAASDFDHVDPALGGDAALHRLLRAVHDHRMRCVGDLTLNHTGSGHPWFRTAVEDAAAPESGLYRFAARPDDYATFAGVPTLPKLDYANAITHDRMYRSPDSVARRWLTPPHGLDGWRIDVASMVGRLGADDANRQIATAFVEAARDENPEALIVAEIPHDPTDDLRAGWPGALLDAGFCAPIRRWLSAEKPTSGSELYRSLREFSAALGWQTLTSCVGHVGSHDHPRLRTVTGTRSRASAAFFLLMTFPSIPMVFAGDEFGVVGATADLARTPMPWPGTGLPADVEQARVLNDMTRMRRASDALTRGGFRWLAATEHSIAFLRSGRDGRVLCLATNRPTGVVVDVGAPAATAEPLLTAGALAVEGRRVRFVSTEGALCGAWRLLP